jgi:DNA modification methylase
MFWDDIRTGDNLAELAKIPNGSFDLIFADPPFNIGYEYDVYQDKRGREEYLKWTERWLQACQRVLKPSGSFWVAIGDEYAAEMKIRLDALGLTMRNWVIWHYTFGVSCSKKFSRSHAHLFYYVADPKTFTFDNERIRVPSARQTTYNDRRANSSGKLPDDTWVLRPSETDSHFQAESDTWAISRVCGTFSERTGHPCQMPEAVLERIIRSTSRLGDTVLDPFAGSGTTLAVAKRLRRQYLGIELSPDYADAIRDRLLLVKPESDSDSESPQPKSLPRTPGRKRTRAAGLKPR